MQNNRFITTSTAAQGAGSSPTSNSSAGAVHVGGVWCVPARIPVWLMHTLGRPGPQTGYHLVIVDGKEAPVQTLL